MLSNVSPPLTLTKLTSSLFCSFGVFLIRNRARVGNRTTNFCTNKINPLKSKDLFIFHFNCIRWKLSHMKINVSAMNDVHFYICVTTQFEQFEWNIERLYCELCTRKQRPFLWWSHVSKSLCLSMIATFPNIVTPVKLIRQVLECHIFLRFYEGFNLMI